MKVIHSVTVTAAAIALLAFSAPAPAFSQTVNAPKHHKQDHAQTHRTGAMGMPGDMVGMCIIHADKMGLSEDQTMKMKPIYREMQKKDAQFKADLTIAEIELSAIMEVKDFDLEKASAAVKKIEDIKTAHHVAILKDMKEMRAVLTDEQFKNMEKTMSMQMSRNRPTKRMMKKNSQK
ncbi:MAG: hypothetical protein PHH28_04350 [Desulfuromonadaceae bacterium]|nr:hypothetical protein [Desulfuromonadaceae bacterium]